MNEFVELVDVLIPDNRLLPTEEPANVSENAEPVFELCLGYRAAEELELIPHIDEASCKRSAGQEVGVEHRAMAYQLPLDAHECGRLSRSRVLNIMRLVEQKCHMLVPTGLNK